MRPTTSSVDLARKHLPVIVDTTLRDGAQMPGINLDASQKTTIVEALVALGIGEIELGCPAHSSEERRTIHMFTKTFATAADFSAWCRARSDDIDMAIDCGVGTIHVSFPVSDRHMAVLSRTRRDVLDAVECFTRKIVSANLRCTIGAQDATRADRCFLGEFIRHATDAGASRVRIADTVGIATPQSTGCLISQLKEYVPGCALEFHGHNDFGLATANALAAAEAGADAISVTVLGTGERAGNTPLEQFITAASLLHHCETQLHLATLSSLCATVAKAFNLDIPVNRPIAGKNAFTHESGIHCHGMVRDDLAYQPFSPAYIGRKTRFSMGPKSGRSTMQALLQQTNFDE